MSENIIEIRNRRSIRELKIAILKSCVKSKLLTYVMYENHINGSIVKRLIVELEKDELMKIENVVLSGFGGGKTSKTVNCNTRGNYSASLKGRKCYTTTEKGREVLKHIEFIERCGLV